MLDLVSDRSRIRDPGLNRLEVRMVSKVGLLAEDGHVIDRGFWCDLHHPPNPARRFAPATCVKGVSTAAHLHTDACSVLLVL
jgi:hypothetical protein